MNLKLLPMLFAITLAAGCATMPPPIVGRPGLLNFIADNKTTKEEVIATLGQPSGKFEWEKILTYRLGFESKSNGFYVVKIRTEAKYSLVLVFDENNILRKHSLVEVR